MSCEARDRVGGRVCSTPQYGELGAQIVCGYEGHPAVALADQLGVDMGQVSMVKDCGGGSRRRLTDGEFTVDSEVVVPEGNEGVTADSVTAAAGSVADAQTPRVQTRERATVFLSRRFCVYLFSRTAWSHADASRWAHSPHRRACAAPRPTPIIAVADFNE